MDADADAVRAAVGNGATLDEAAQLLIDERGLDPIPAIKAIRAGGDVGLGTAKEIVHRNLPEQVRLDAERLWDEIEAAVREYG